MKNKNRCYLPIFIGVLTSVLTFTSVLIAVLWMFDRKKKREDKELDEYYTEEMPFYGYYRYRSKDEKEEIH